MIVTRRSRRLGSLIALLVGFAGVLPAAAQEVGGEFGVLGGFTLYDRDLAGQSSELEPSVGVRGASLFTPHFGWFVDALYDTNPGRTFRGDSQSITARTGFDYLFRPGGESSWFVTAGGGFMRVEFDTAANFGSAFVSAGVGQKIWLSGKKHLRWELRADQSLTEDGLEDFSDNPGPDVTQARFLMGLTWGPGGAATDEDADGILDRRDRCPATPVGAAIDREGCPSDSDGDGVYDGLDLCSETAAGIAVTVDGCAKDADGDGVPDTLDACAQTRSGAPVDARGCVPDGDGDGVDDGMDMCPDTPAGVTVSISGCSRDTDSDGVYDGLDRCPATAPGVRIDRDGCPLDGDEDGVPDGLDRCPETPSDATVDREGCTVAAPLFEDDRTTLVLKGVTFELNSSTLTRDSTRILNSVADALLDWPEVRVEIGGHTDSLGSYDQNMELSRRRAETVRNHLIKRGIASTRLEARGYGEIRPIADNRDEDGRQQNRRVELRRLDSE